MEIYLWPPEMGREQPVTDLSPGSSLFLSPSFLSPAVDALALYFTH